ncbi:MAG: hypothetical protein WKF51_09335 [Geodermatophilaceae bacterium]
MSTTWSTFRARFQDTEFACTPEQLRDGLRIHLLSEVPREGFGQLQPGTYVRLVLATECSMVAHVTMTCQWQGEPCMVHDERSTADGDELLLEYTGGKVPRALELGMQRIERGVYRRWAPRDQIRDLRETRTSLERPNN